MNIRFFSFVAGGVGAWTVVDQRAVIGEPLPEAPHLDVVAGDAGIVDATWSLRGITSNERYVERSEREALVASQEGLNRGDSTCAVLIPIRKSAEWWGMTQDARRRIFEDRSRHIAIGLQYLPQIARRLHHCRDLSESEPFDFLTWFEFAPAHEAMFDELVAQLRRTIEWQFVEREVEIRLRRVRAV